MDKQAAYLQAIGQAYPDLVIENVRANFQNGQFNDILVINDELIFRFPKYADSIETLLTEVHILKRIQGWVTLPIPNPIYTSPKDIRTVSKVFMGYPLIPGKPLWRETLAKITNDTIRQKLADQLAGFLKALHGVPIEQLNPGLPVHDGPDQWGKLYNDIRDHLFPLMRPDAQTWVRNHFESYLNNPRLHAYKICLRHDDFGTGNILYDDQTQEISGIIDFGSAGLGDAALDIAAASCYEESFFNRFYDAYPEIESMLERAQFYKGTYALQEALHGLLNNDQEAFKSGMAEYL
jgi:aminoglycoside 2''-phosphotransferase